MHFSFFLHPTRSRHALLWMPSELSCLAWCKCNDIYFVLLRFEPKALYPTTVLAPPPPVPRKVYLRYKLEQKNFIETLALTT